MPSKWAMERASLHVDDSAMEMKLDWARSLDAARREARRAALEDATEAARKVMQHYGMTNEGHAALTTMNAVKSLMRDTDQV